MSLVGVLVGVLAVWRLTHLLQAEDGPWDLSVRMRRAAGTGFWGQLLDCFHCLSLWVAVPAAILLAPGWGEGMLLWLGLSGGAILFERITTPAAHYVEDPVEEQPDVLLRKDEAATGRRDDLSKA